MKSTLATLLLFLALPFVALADSWKETYPNFVLSDGVTTQVCETVTVEAKNCKTVAIAPTTTPTLRLVNVSIRGKVGRGDDVVILGFIVPEGGPYSFVIVARGPSLFVHGVLDALPDPVLAIYDASGTMFDSNDNWDSPERRESIIASGRAPSDPREAATSITLKPGAYTAILSGANGSTGVGIVELFAR